ncbi:hypothetical protein SHELI_v1c03210 [Spiroplasma helicoides]|uniref:Uncharacterized protein n=1 Tax=Spiroplasma helicoides TaxID=216938 RepID=A0A1B3SK19_9MOLU|nr:hypothetical protein [Spiroplasma helicoides]AOG60276.1 hypothetical protein SHELI_v1c03210 [Spiroplasma helicoides]
MCCKCKSIYIENCTCLIYESECFGFVCCWCCAYSKWENDELKGQIYKTLTKDIDNILNKNKHLKVLKKVLKKQLKDIELNSIEFEKLKLKNYSKLLDGEKEIQILAYDMELELGLKIRCLLKEWEIYIEMSNLVIGLDRNYTSKSTFLTMFELCESINKSIYNMVELFKTISYSDENKAFLNSIKQKFIDIEKILNNLENNLDNKIGE